MTNVFLLIASYLRSSRGILHGCEGRRAPVGGIRSPRPVALAYSSTCGHEVTEAVVLLGACRAARQVLAHAWDARIRILARECRIDVHVEEVKALVTRQLHTCGPEQSAD